MNFFSVFGGIGGFDLGLERANWRCVGQCEIEPFCTAALEKHWPNVWRWQDVKTLTGELVRQHCGRVDAIIGGPPCQPSSVAGQRRGAADDRWLWPEFLRLVSEVRPVWVLAENPRGVLSIDVEGVQFGVWLAGEFAARGYELIPIELAAEDVGAPHRRERVWFVAYRHGGRQQQPERLIGEERRWVENGSGDGQAVTTSDGWREGRAESAGQQGRFDAAICGSKLDDARCERLEAGWDRSEQAADGEVFNHQPERAGANAMADAQGVGEREPHDSAGAVARERTRQGVSGRGNGIRNGVGLANPCDTRLEGQRDGTIGAGAEVALPAGLGSYCWPARPGESQHEWEAPRVIAAESEMGFTIDGLPVNLARWRVAALKACGNAIVPQCAEVLGQMINRAQAALRPEQPVESEGK